MEKSTEGSEFTQAIVVSDLHIGDPHSRHEQFVRLVKGLDHQTALILNGDIIDNPYKKLDAKDQAATDFIRAQSMERRVIWLFGNHDEGFRMNDPGRIEFRKHMELGNRLMIVHGDDFDEVMPKSLWFIRLFKLMHRIRLRLGAPPVHVAELAKKWAPFLYRVLTEEVKMNAVQCAIEGQFEAITCGHTHYAEDSICEGVRYINTGAWTESPSHYLLVMPTQIVLKRI
jgi:UDP-2,3-diacylglucosamine pyrophosphatase LpxH